MAEFGVFPGRESRVYSVGIEAYSLPVSLVFPVAGGGPRDFVFVPDGDMTKEFAGPLEGSSFSKALDSIYRYVGRGRTEVLLSDGSSYPLNRKREARFALVKWDKAADLDFPTGVYCIQRSSFGGSGRVMHEVRAATSVSVQQVGGAR